MIDGEGYFDEMAEFVRSCKDVFWAVNRGHEEYRGEKARLYAKLDLQIVGRYETFPADMRMGMPFSLEMIENLKRNCQERIKKYF